jgi:hypothetical protein
MYFASRPKSFFSHDYASNQPDEALGLEWAFLSDSVAQ